MGFISGIWTQKAGKNQSKQAILTYEMKKGHILGVGSTSNKVNNLLLIKNVTSRWCSHAFAFGDENQQKQLKDDLASIYEQNLSIGDLRSLSKVTVNFEICNEAEDLQNKEAMEQLKYIALLKEILAIQVGQTHDPKQTVPQHVADGIIKTKYEEKLQADVTKLQLTSSVIKIKGAEWIEPVTIVEVQNPDQPY